MAGIQDFAFPETQDPRVDVNNLAADPTAQAMRNNFMADIVILFTNGNYGLVRGIVAAIGPNDNQAYSIVQVNHASATKSCPHEIGHLYGGKHQDDNSAPAFAKAYIIKNWLGIVKGRTILTGRITDSQGANRLLNFSNPNVRVDGRATGTSNNNNAQRVTETFATVRAFRADPPYPMGVYVQGPDELFSPVFETYEAVYSCGSSPYSFSWANSTDGVNYYAASSNADTYTHFFDFQAYQSYWFYTRVTVIDGNGTSVTSFKSTYVNVPPSGFSAAARINPGSGLAEPEEKLNADAGLTVFPNPSDEITTVDYSLLSESDVEVEIIDNTGNLVKSIRIGSQKAGQHTLTLDVKNMQPGLYHCRLKTKNSVLTKRISVKK